MREPESNWNLRRVNLSFPYVRVLVRGRPEHKEEYPKHQPMDLVHRAKIFAPFDALDGYSAKIKEKDKSFIEPEPEKAESNICTFWEDP